MENRLTGIFGAVLGGIAGFTLARSQTHEFCAGYGLALFFAALSIYFFIRSLNRENGGKRDKE